jgi:hypothetical protein
MTLWIDIGSRASWLSTVSSFQVNFINGLSTWQANFLQPQGGADISGGEEKGDEMS